MDFDWQFQHTLGAHNHTLKARAEEHAIEKTNAFANKTVLEIRNTRSHEQIKREN